MRKYWRTVVFLSVYLLLAFGLTTLNSSEVNSNKEPSAIPKNVKAPIKSSSVNPAVDPALYQAMEYRLIGPYRGGRSPAVTGVRNQPFTYYMGTCGGGVWKTTDAGQTWVNVSDGYFQCSSIGAVAVANSNPNVIYVGTGEPNLRGNVQTGVGVYKSVDAGRTWKHVGLEDSRHIGQIRIHPQDPDLVYAAVLGHAFGPNQERGVYRSENGGATWEKVLYVSDKAGAVDLAMDANNPRILYAGIYQVIRKPWVLISGGEDSGRLFKSTDGGESWIELKNGLPQGVKGRIGVAVSPANSERVWVNIEAKDKDGGVYRSEDGGKNFFQVNRSYRVRGRHFYYTHIFAHPVDENTVYVLTSSFNKSVDGGKTFTTVRVPHGDTHGLWINPDNPNIMINGNDGGACVSFNDGKTWSTIMNQPTAEFYRVTTDNQFLYRVYGCQQDNSTVSIPSRTTGSGITIQHWYPVGGGEQGHIWVDPRDSNIVFAGSYEGIITRYDHRTGQRRQIKAYPELAEGIAVEELSYRFQMNAPIRISPHDPKILYHTSQHVHKSADEGQSWEIISPDLSRNDKSKQKPSGGPITLDHTGPETYNTIFAFEESPHKPGLLWAGTDDGLVHLSQDGGTNWENIAPKGIPDWATINMIEPSPHDPGRAFIAVHNYRLDDFTPYIFRTDDYGKSWTLITKANGIPSNHFIRVVREDPDRKGLLYAGTEFGMYISFNDGKSWQSFQLNLPVAQIADMVIKEKDLVVATHGRSFWILDDLTPLHQITDEVAQADFFLFNPRDTYRIGGGGRARGIIGIGQNPPNGAVVYYKLAEAPDKEVRLEFLDSKGNAIQTFSSNESGRISVKAGLNRFLWDLRYPRADVVRDAIFYGGNIGPNAVPGTYQVRMTVGEWSQTQSFEVKKDLRLSTTQEEFQKQFDLVIKIRDKITETHNAIRKIRNVRNQIQNLSHTLKHEKDIVQEAKNLMEQLTAVEEKLMQTKNELGGQTTCNFPPQLDNHFVNVLNVVLSADAQPTEGSYEVFEGLKPRLDQHINRLQEILDKDLAAFNELIRKKNIPPVVIPVKGI